MLWFFRILGGAKRPRPSTDSLIFPNTRVFYAIQPTIQVKNLPEDLLKELRRLKVELGCQTWADLLARLVEPERVISLSKERLTEMKTGVQEFLKLGTIVSNRWTGPPTVLEETRRTRNHGEA